MNGIDHYDVEMGGTRANGDGEVHHEGDNSFETVLSSQAMSISESVNDYGLQEEYNNIDVIQTLIDTLFVQCIDRSSCCNFLLKILEILL